MKVVNSISELRAVLREPRTAGRSLGFVPTMGALHEGHLSLMRIALERTDLVVMSIFVNPLQFGPTEDFGAYPRVEEADLKLAEAEGVDITFLPSVEEMYPEGAATTIHVGGLAYVLEGEHRPGHFDGVVTVVAKLFNAVEPDLAVFGQKDAQQLAVIRKMVADLDLDIEIAVGETIREADGLALSSRNSFLSPEERSRAAALFKALEAGADLVRAGESYEAVEDQMLSVLVGSGLHVDYAVAVDPVTFEEPKGPTVLLAIAARLGSTRLIDNMIVEHLEHGTGSAGL